MLMGRQKVPRGVGSLELDYLEVAEGLLLKVVFAERLKEAETV
jgi:hypothetical protein